MQLPHGNPQVGAEASGVPQVGTDPQKVPGCGQKLMQGTAK